MKGDVEEEAPRPRPLSAGLWTLFSWLRRTERSSSSESISSVGSDRTAASFDFLAPLHYKHIDRHLVLPHTPITDTYRKRLQERNIRRQNDRDLTLRRKYGLYTEEELGYDAFSLPPARKVSKDSARQRRATSETIQRRAAYVPGKRRAPLPPIVISTSLPRNYKRKRPAPKPPLKLEEDNKENIEVTKNKQMSSKPALEKHSLDTNNSLENKIEKSTRHDTSKDVKLRTEKSFLKQIFDSRKRNSAIDISHVKLLPSISELDKQANEIIETNRSLCANRSNNNDSATQNADVASSSNGIWICTICLRKYKSTIIACVYCVRTDAKEKSLNNVTFSSTATNTSLHSDKNRNSDDNEKKKLREMLKEMKDSLPKRPKHDKGKKDIILPETETPTLRIGSTFKDEKVSNQILSNDNTNNETKVSSLKVKDSFLTPQPSSSKQIVSDIILSNMISGKKEKPKFHLDIFQDNSKRRAGKISNNSDEENFRHNSMIFTNSVKNEPLNTIKESSLINNSSTNQVSREIQRHDISLKIEDASKISNVSTQNAGVINGISINIPKEIIKDRNSITTVKHPNTANLLATNRLQTSSADKVKIFQENSIRNSILIPTSKKTCNQKNDQTVNNKIETIRIGDIISSNMVQKLESNANVSSVGSSTANLHVPLKVSSLLNPLYCPKNQSLGDTKKESKSNDKNIVLVASTKPCTADATSPFPPLIKQENSANQSTKFDLKPNTIENNSLGHHARRRDLVNQLEQAIARGEEQAAAEAAAQLAKLKLTCSVLSFSSQIVGEPLIASKNKDLVIETNSLKGDNPTNQQHKQHEKTISKSNIKTEIKINIIPKEKSETTKTVNNDDQNKSIVEIQNPIPTTSKQNVSNPEENILIEVWVEDKEAARGPIGLRVPRKAVVGDLKRQAEKTLGIEIRLQRWIIGRSLCSRDNTPLIALAGPDLSAPFYLCLVESEKNKDNISESKHITDKNTDNNETKNVITGDFYTELMKLEQQAFVPNTQEFECGVCIEQIPVGAGAILRECIHSFCKECLCDVVRHCEEPIVTCPAIGCPGVLQEREIRALLAPEEYERWLARGLAAAESGTRNTFHCRTKDCTGWAFCEPGVRRFPCPVCKHTNCLPCQAVHEDETCEKYQAKLRDAVTAVESNQNDEGTKALIKSLIDKGEALECPECKAIITKKWGCDWIKCSACKTEICWVTRGRRWGPGGKGDTSGGCRCGVDGKRCHPSCGYCH